MEGRRFTVRNEAFQCAVCGAEVAPLRAGGCRNHCPRCLHSLHLDNLPGDRAADCGGVMVPVSIYRHAKKGYMVEHRCRTCGHRAVNKLALDDPAEPDDFGLVLRFMAGRP